jgi:hypothetical protein
MRNSLILALLLTGCIRHQVVRVPVTQACGPAYMSVDVTPGPSVEMKQVLFADGTCGWEVVSERVKGEKP